MSEEENIPAIPSCKLDISKSQMKVKEDSSNTNAMDIYSSSIYYSSRR